VCGGVYIYGTRAARERQVGVGVGGPGSTYARRARPRTHGARALTVRPHRPLSLSPVPPISEGKGCPMRGGSRLTPVLGGWDADPWGT